MRNISNIWTSLDICLKKEKKRSIGRIWGRCKTHGWKPPVMGRLIWELWLQEPRNNRCKATWGAQDTQQDCLQIVTMSVSYGSLERLPNVKWIYIYITGICDEKWYSGNVCRTKLPSSMVPMKGAHSTHPQTPRWTCVKYGGEREPPSERPQRPELGAKPPHTFLRWNKLSARQHSFERRSTSKSTKRDVNARHRVLPSPRMGGEKEKCIDSLFFSLRFG